MLVSETECLTHTVMKNGWHNGRLGKQIFSVKFEYDSIRLNHIYFKINVVFDVLEKSGLRTILQCTYLLVLGPVSLRFRQRHHWTCRFHVPE